MVFKLPDLPYEKKSLEPYISSETLDFHHGKHHNTYVTKLNALISGTEFENKTLEEIIQNSSGSVFNNAAQIWNHTFYWHCLAPKAGGQPTGFLANSIVTTFGSFKKFKQEFTESAINNFGSSWTWLVSKTDGSLKIINTSNALTPLKEKETTPILTVDLWEHAYYIDYRNVRLDYMNAFWALVNWNFVEKKLIG
ncbi:superoxide dismutase [Candidatus Photodesmus katoptron]|uniref:Superoxide dismutase n=1 Tax=Candidatus Photodesmus katoptron Akat1 TaxID=1236703 RepID=S3DI72_9GAMM|nr:Fe-Mn family superoxide dismutase [Candidatus Photodesmus katoptron]EPE37395.1 superoxide dismutase [Candidatus Photodesmus katoptron Akat1]KEY90802.1 superoxide dismutase [Candidatus Photodesmus katoptron]